MEEYQEMEMPTPCVHCGNLFDLNDGYGSEKWHEGITICHECYETEQDEIAKDSEIEDLKCEISEAEYTITSGIKRLKELGVEYESELCKK